MDRQLEEPRPQPRGALPVRLRLRIRGRHARLRHVRSDRPEERRPLGHLPRGGRDRHVLRPEVQRRVRRGRP